MSKRRNLLLLHTPQKNSLMAGMGSLFPIYKYAPSHSCWLMIEQESPDLEVSQQISCLDPLSGARDCDAAAKPDLKTFASWIDEMVTGTRKSPEARAPL